MQGGCTSCFLSANQYLINIPHGVNSEERCQVLQLSKPVHEVDLGELHHDFMRTGEECFPAMERKKLSQRTSESESDSEAKNKKQRKY